jgi:transcriptional regulator with XRE-family HTH domain
MVLAERLKTMREQKGLSQQALAEAARMTQSAFSRLEAGVVQQPRLAVLKRLAEALGVSVDYLVGTVRVPITKHPADPAVGELLETYEGLSLAERKQLLDYARFLKAQAASPPKKQKRRARH